MTDKEESVHKKELKYTQDIRKMFIDELSKHKTIPDDKEHIIFLVKLLDGHDKSLLTEKKLEADMESNELGKKSNELIAHFLLNHSSKLGIPIESNSTPPELEKSIDPADIINGELDQGIVIKEEEE